MQLPSLRRFRSVFKAKQPDPRHVVGSDEFCGNLQNGGIQANGGSQQYYNSQQAYSPQQPYCPQQSYSPQQANSSQQPFNPQQIYSPQQPYSPQDAFISRQDSVIQRRPVGNGSNNSQPVSPIQPYSPQDPGNRQMFAPRVRPVHELEGTRGSWAPVGDEHMSRGDFQRQYNYNQNAHVLQQAKDKSKLVAERLERAEVEKARLERYRNASKQSVLHLRELIRERYRLDLSIWREREALEADRELVMVECRKADGILKKMYSMVSMWDENLFEAKEWKVAKRIKDGLLQPDQHVTWTETPPWMFGEDGRLLSEDSEY